MKMVMPFTLIVSFLFLICKSALPPNAEERLASYLLHADRYNKLIRPAKNSSEIVTIAIKVSLSQLISVVSTHCFHGDNITEMLKLCKNVFQNLTSTKR
ncbi:hypothetical protein scyTo_0003221 [Scyliorhinus torazame]|uniref:Neurotransmitter-gated ion-channel ligand-binding domain-containing protein n=1 Tax=Scyliorhinus torazame TaxID=75743 RepID=A0A401PLW5_SCYTO|nr:hypothetical protein [Scyliorhinus torazame]